MNRKQRIRISESQLKQIVTESVKRILKEEAEGEGVPSFKEFAMRFKEYCEYVGEKYSSEDAKAFYKYLTQKYNRLSNEGKPISFDELENRFFCDEFDERIDDEDCEFLDKIGY